jgi:hypothetical protein
MDWKAFIASVVGSLAWPHKKYSRLPTDDRLQAANFSGYPGILPQSLTLRWLSSRAAGRMTYLINEAHSTPALDSRFGSPA